MSETNLIIIGSGPAGYTAAIYAVRAGLKPVLFAGTMVGGQLTTTDYIENFPGFPTGIRGEELMANMRQQCENLGVNIIHEEIVSVDFSNHPFTLKSGSGEGIEAQSIIIATGAAPKMLGIENEKKFLGFGVSTCATCDGFFYRNKTVAVVGGGNTAVMEALHLAKVAKKVYLIHRRDQLRADKVMQERILHSPVEIIWDSAVISLEGSLNPPNLTTVTIQNLKTNQSQTVAFDGLFVAIGSEPRTKIFEGQIDMDASGYIITHPDSCQTSIKGIFAAGDVQNPRFKQAILAASSGALAALEARNFLEEM